MPSWRLARSLPLVVVLALAACAGPPPADPLRIACVGDSITEGTANADHAANNWPAILGRLLEATHPGGYTVANFGRSGATALRASATPYTGQDVYAASLEWAPDVVVLNLGTNDAAPANWGPHGTQFLADLEALIDDYARLPSAPAIWLSTLTPVFPHSPRFADVEGSRAAVQAGLVELAERRGLPLIDLTTPLADALTHFPDGLHPDTAANEAIAGAVFTALTGKPAQRDPTLRPGPVDGEPHLLVEAGRALDVDPGSWQVTADGLQGHGAGQRLTAGVTLGAGDFAIDARLRMLDQDDSAAGFQLGGIFFGFEGARGTLFRNGSPVFGLRLLHPTDMLWEPEAWIDFRVVRNGDTVWFLVNGRVVDMALLPGPVERLAFEPMRSTMQIAAWSVTGPVERVVPPHMRRRTKQTPWIDVSMHTDWQTVSHPVTTQPMPSLGTRIQGEDGRWLRVYDSVGARTHVATGTDGEAWETSNPAPAILTGSGHSALRLRDGRVLISFHDTHPESPTRGDVVAWVGTWDDLLDGREGQYTARLLAHADLPHGPRDESGVLPDTFWSTTSTELETDGRVHVRAICRDENAMRPTVTALNLDMATLDALVPTPGYDIPLVDLDGDVGRHVVVDREPGQYLGHVTTVLLEDGRTILATYPQGHGRGPIVHKRSADGGRSWSERLPVPENWATSREVPTIHRVIDPATGKKRLIVWSGLYPARLAVSEDDGASWSPLEPVGDWGGIVVMGDVERLADGRYLALFHDDGRFFTGQDLRSDPVVFTLYQTTSSDGGLTWEHPQAIGSGSDVHLCEPGIVRSPDGATLAVLLRENSRTRNSYVIFSDDEGASWSAPRELPAALTGDRHTAQYAPDGRLFLSFRDTTRESPTQGDWVGWVGTWEDIVRGTPGQYRVRIKDNQHRWDTTYPGVEVLPDGTFVVTTYGHWEAGEEPYILSARFTLDELDARLASGD